MSHVFPSAAKCSQLWSYSVVFRVSASAKASVPFSKGQHTSIIVMRSPSVNMMSGWRREPVSDTLVCRNGTKVDCVRKAFYDFIVAASDEDHVWHTVVEDVG